MQTYISALRNVFPNWPEIKKLEKNFSDLETKLLKKENKINPELLKLVGKGENVPIKQEKKIIKNYLKQKH